MPVRQPDFLLPVRALSNVFRGKSLAVLAVAHGDNRIEHNPQGNATDWSARHRQLSRHPWAVYAKAPLGGPAQVLEYLSR